MHPLLIEIPESFETKRLELRRYQFGDGKAYFRMLERNRDHLQDAASKRLLNLNNEEEAEIYIRELINDWAERKRFVLGVWDKVTEEYVAEIWIEANDWENSAFEMGWFVDTDKQGIGYVTEAANASIIFIFESLHAHRIMITTADTNHKSVAVAKRCGFIKEGHLRERHKQIDGAWRGTFYFGMLKSDYQFLK